MNYALHEALRLILEEGLERRWKRHLLHGKALAAGLEALGLEPFAQAGHALPMLVSMRLPEGLEDAAIRRRLLDEFGIEIGGGLGAQAGKIWRVGLMGETARRKNVFALLAALEVVLGSDAANGSQAPSSLEAAATIYEHA
jgi:alanine-glyoxylate transaminase/serine-glyoxylate transaminase/serine-pyruvate transaminase